jgi:hypothetical protein
LGEASPKAQQLLGVLQQFMEAHVYPAEHTLEEHATGPNRCGVAALTHARLVCVRTWNAGITCNAVGSS